MHPYGDFDGVDMAVVNESLLMGELTALVLVNKDLYMHLQTVWNQRVLELYELQVTWIHRNVRAHARKELLCEREVSESEHPRFYSINRYCLHWHS